MDEMKAMSLEERYSDPLFQSDKHGETTHLTKTGVVLFDCSGEYVQLPVEFLREIVKAWDDRPGQAVSSRKSATDELDCDCCGCKDNCETMSKQEQEDWCPWA